MIPNHVMEKKDKDNTVCYFPFLLNKGANKRVSLSSIFFTMFCHKTLTNACSVCYISHCCLCWFYADSGYQLDLPEGPLIFHTADCAPADAYMFQNYVLYVLFCYDTHDGADGADGDLVLFTLTDFMYLMPWIGWQCMKWKIKR